MERMFKDTKQLNAAIETFARKDHSHYADMKNVIAGAILHVADHGDCTPLTKLYNEVSVATGSVIVRVLRKLNAWYGEDHRINGAPFPVFDKKSDTGTKKQTFFLTKEFKVGGEIVMIVDDTEQGAKGKQWRKEILAKIAKDDENAIGRIIDADLEAARDNTRLFDGAKKVKDFIKSMASTQFLSVPQLQAINGMIENKEQRYTAADVEKMFKDGAVPGTFTNTDQADLDRLNAKLARAKAEGKVASPEAEKAENNNEQPANEKPARAQANA